MKRLSREADRAAARNDQRELQRIANEIAALLAADDPEAVSVYERHQRQQLGPNPLAEYAEEWPEALAVRRGPALTVSPDEPLYGWRAWRVQPGRLSAPFLTVKWGLSERSAGVAWRAGSNSSTTAHCSTRSRGRREEAAREGKLVHPLATCRCGIRVVQSLTVLERFTENMDDSDMAGDVAFGRVAFWGRVAPWSPDDDWRYTARAQHAAIVGDFLLHESLEHLRPGLVAAYGPELEAPTCT